MDQGHLARGQLADGAGVDLRGLQVMPDIDPGLQRIERLGCVGGGRLGCRQFTQRGLQVGKILVGGGRLLGIMLQPSDIPLHLSLPSHGLSSGGVARIALRPCLVNRGRIAVPQGGDKRVLALGFPSVGHRQNAKFVGQNVLHPLLQSIDLVGGMPVNRRQRFFLLGGLSGTGINNLFCTNSGRIGEV